MNFDKESKSWNFFFLKGGGGGGVGGLGREGMGVQDMNIRPAILYTQDTLSGPLLQNSIVA